LTKKENIKKLEHIAEKKIIKRATNLMDNLKELHVDPLGLGEKARQKGIFNEKEWEDQYGELPITIQAKVHVIQAGVME
jgi:spore germination protein